MTVKKIFIAKFINPRNAIGRRWNS